MIAAVYGLQAIVFIMRRKWDMIGWMVFYILAVPVFSFFLPLYSFWRMDDFSWGATRIVLGESGKKMVVHVRPRPSTTHASSHCLRRMRVNLILAPFLSNLGTTTCVFQVSSISVSLIAGSGERALGQGVEPQYRFMGTANEVPERRLRGVSHRFHVRSRDVLRARDVHAPWLLAVAVAGGHDVPSARISVWQKHSDDNWLLDGRAPPAHTIPTVHQLPRCANPNKS